MSREWKRFVFIYARERVSVRVSVLVKRAQLWSVGQVCFLFYLNT